MKFRENLETSAIAIGMILAMVLLVALLIAFFSTFVWVFFAISIVFFVMWLFGAPIKITIDGVETKYRWFSKVK